MIPAPPRIGSYPSEDCTFLLKELACGTLELPAEEREALLRAGGHYSETLPIEYEPTAEYEALYEALLARQAAIVARMTLILAERIHAERHDSPVLVSLARAGTPVGVLLRRALHWLHGLDVPHYSISIIRDRGIDEQALRFLLERHRPEQLVLVDGWIGKGVIAAELAKALRLHAGVDPVLAVLADPAATGSLCATQDDVLIPSACLNSTVSGLISRTVLPSGPAGAQGFHGTRVYREFAGRDRSNAFIAAVTAHFGDERAAAARGVATARALTPEPGRGMRAVQRVQRAWGITDVNRVKPGVGETTRVLLRRVPRAVLVDPRRRHEVEHIVMLAEQRGVPVHEHEDPVYSSFGLIAEA